MTGVRADLAAGTASLGGSTIQTDLLASEFIELLRARLITAMLGVRTMFGLQGNVSIPAQTAGATGAWLAEAAPITPSAQTFAQVPLSPKRYGAATAYSRQLVVQSSIDVEAFVRMDLAAVVARGFDLAVIAGSGAGGQPTGILSTSGIGTVTFGGAASWAKVLEFETTVATANADFGNLAYLSTPATRGKWKGIPKEAAGTNGYLWMDGALVPAQPPVGALATADSPPIGLVNGYRAIASTIVPTNRVIYGNWSDAILGMWIPLEVVVDPYSLALNHQVRVVVNALGDVAVRHAASFCASTDTGAA
jgi:HK97 family phage major capsid protein